MTPSQRPGRPNLSAAVAVFAEHGYAATSEEDLCEAMALDPADFRCRFTDAEGCFLAAYDSLIATAQASLAAGLPADAPWATRLAAGFHCLLGMIDANPAAARLVLVESQLAGEAALRRYIATLESFAPFLREGRRCCTAPEQLPSITDSVLPGGLAFALHCQLLRAAPARDLYPEMLRFLLLPYLGEAGTAACLAISPPPGPAGDAEQL